MQSITIEPPNKSNHTPRPQSPTPSLPHSFSSLPEDIVLNCLARISKSFYPKLSLVSNSFRWLVLSHRLYKVRKQLKTEERCVYLGLQSPTNPCLIWYSLWIKTDHQTLSQCTIQDKSTGYLLAPVPSSYSCDVPSLICVLFGSEIYKIGGKNSPSSLVRVYNERTGKWRDAPSMMVARLEALVCVFDGKIYAMGGCRADESKYWAEVFDPMTQTWEPLPDPGPEVRFSSNKRLQPVHGKIYVMTKKNVNANKKNFLLSQQKKKKKFAYLVKENKWEVDKENLVESFCLIDNVQCCYADKKWWWHDTKSEVFRLVKGLTGLDVYSMNDIEIGTYEGKLLIFWDSFALSPTDQTKQIWCAVVMLDKRIDGEVWGQIEWVHTVQTVPVSYALVRCVYLST